MELQGRRVLLTGGGSGIGRELALELAEAGARTVIVGRREEALEETAGAAGGETWSIAADLTEPGAPARVVAEAVEKLGGLDLLVNNAGNVVAGRLEQVAESDIHEMVALDLLAPILLTREALPALRDDGGGTVVLVSSAIALVGLPFYSTYAGVKAGLAHFGEALRRELQGEGVDVLVAYPGATDTPMMESSEAGPELGFDAEPAEDVARAIVDALREDRRDVIRGGEVRRQMVETNREQPEKVDERFAGMKDDLEEAVKDHRSV